MDKKYKKLHFWGLALLLYPFVSTVLYGLFSQYTYLIHSYTLERSIEGITSVMTNTSLFAAFFGLSAVIGAVVLVKTRGRDLLAIFITSMGLLFLYACVYIYLW